MCLFHYRYTVFRKNEILNGKKMDRFVCTVPCQFGLEAIVKKEIVDLGYEIKEVKDGRVTFFGDGDAIARTNIWLRVGERVLLDIGDFDAFSFDDLFENIKKLPWENYIPKNGKFWVKKATSIKSKVYSARDIQTITKKAIVNRLSEKYNVTWFEESGAEYPVRVFIQKNHVYVSLDTSGDGLHKRGYRILSSRAPIRETLAAGLVQLSPWNKDRIFVDPFCGSGTLPIEAAMIGANIAPGLNREFDAEKWENIVPRKLWMNAVDEAYDVQDTNAKLNIQGFDADYRVIKVARDCANNAMVEDYIHFQERKVQDFRSNKHYGVVVTNPPYGERLENAESVKILYKDMGDVFGMLDDWSFVVITSFEEFEKYYGKKATKNRKLYNGMLKSYIYQYLGPKPKRVIE